MRGFPVIPIVPNRNGLTCSSIGMQLTSPRVMYITMYTEGMGCHFLLIMFVFAVIEGEKDDANFLLLFFIACCPKVK